MRSAQEKLDGHENTPLDDAINDAYDTISILNVQLRCCEGLMDYPLPQEFLGIADGLATITKLTRTRLKSILDAMEGVKDEIGLESRSTAR